MKRLIFLCGPNGVGKSTVSQALLRRLDRSAYVDSDWCRAMNPFVFSEEHRAIVKANLLTLLAGYLRCSTVDTVLFSYGLHGPRKQIFEDVLGALQETGVPFTFHPIVLECSEAENIARMQRDGREQARIDRAVASSREPYGEVQYPRIDTTALTVEETVAAVLRVLEISPVS